MWIVGMMGSGKTTAGRIAAENLDVAFHDTDDVIVERMGCSIAQFWGDRGEEAFREIEKVATADLAERSGVTAAGGGVVLDDDNRSILKRAQKVVWLQADPETLAARVQGRQDRPLVAENGATPLEAFTEMLGERSHLYAEVATHKVNTDAIDSDQVASALEEIWKS